MNSIEKPEQNVDEIILVDKPKGITSFDVIRKLRRKLGIRKMGHAGTLDPLASGLMIIGVGKGTKKLANLIKLDKTYDAEIILGEKRSTGDLEGEILEDFDVQLDTEDSENKITEGQILKILNEMIGILDLPVPVYSAIKREGEALYKKARRGEKVEVPIKQMKVLDVEFVKAENFITDDGKKRIRIYVNFDVGSGTYIRSLAEEVGRRLGFPATLGNLRRIRVGDFDIKDSIKL
jgi:tRNA pseudouridine55 synthase